MFPRFRLYRVSHLDVNGQGGWLGKDEIYVLISKGCQTVTTGWLQGVNIKRTWWNWRKERFLARGEVVGHTELFERTYPVTERTGNWERSIAYEPPVREAVIFLHPDAPDCFVVLEIMLNTFPSPTIRRQIKSLRNSPAGAPHQVSLDNLRDQENTGICKRTL